MFDKMRKLISFIVIYIGGQQIWQILGGVLLIIVGAFCSMDVSFKKESRLWENPGISIQIAAERYLAEIEAKCYVNEEGKVTLRLFAGEWPKEPVRVWIFITDLYWPFEWETADGIENVTLHFLHSDGEILEEEYTAAVLLNGVQRLVSQRTSCNSGISEKNILGSYNEFFTALIEPEGDDYYLYFQMKPEYVELESKGNTWIRIPWVVSMRQGTGYQMDVNDFKDLMETGIEGDSFFLNNCIIDDHVVTEPDLYISGRYRAKYCTQSDYIIEKIVPKAEIVIPDIVWNDKIQLIPTLIFHDLNYEKIAAAKSWFGGILIALGSGLAVLPLSGWIKAAKKE